MTLTSPLQKHTNKIEGAKQPQRGDPVSSTVEINWKNKIEQKYDCKFEYDCKVNIRISTSSPSSLHISITWPENARKVNNKILKNIKTKS